MKKIEGECTLTENSLRIINVKHLIFFSKLDNIPLLFKLSFVNKWLRRVSFYFYYLKKTTFWAVLSFNCYIHKVNYNCYRFCYSQITKAFKKKRIVEKIKKCRLKLWKVWNQFKIDCEAYLTWRSLNTK